MKKYFVRVLNIMLIYFWKERERDRAVGVATYKMPKPKPKLSFSCVVLFRVGFFFPSFRDSSLLFSC
ncbi:hypothetical protein PHAVU_006G217300 [Phaseolus vulgaris]|uniref:Uncharacterized protein n=1 Tax=Phaseolus vulgaris TaxID=3885 RepID=V7BU08_PHAVU|nr:hypothetical protein PHAVU_006G217300g [Phaseolus vulgaris]ESW20535.1 hypothetical protein PHAVU_006G217300g [Phaseolus vulgaris]